MTTTVSRGGGGRTGAPIPSRPARVSKRRIAPREGGWRGMGYCWEPAAAESRREAECNRHAIGIVGCDLIGARRTLARARCDVRGWVYNSAIIGRGGRRWKGRGAQYVVPSAHDDDDVWTRQITKLMSAAGVARSVANTWETVGDKTGQSTAWRTVLYRNTRGVSTAHSRISAVHFTSR